MNVCVICNKEIKNDSQFIKGKWYHNDCIEILQEENEYLKKNQRFHKKFGSNYIFCLEADKETYKDMVLEKQEEVEQLQKRIDSLKDQIEWWKQQCDDLEMQVSNNE